MQVIVVQANTYNAREGTRWPAVGVGPLFRDVRFFHTLRNEPSPPENNDRLAAVLMTRIAACWRSGQHYEIRDTNGRFITADKGRRICAERYRIGPASRATRRNATTTKKLKRVGRDK